MSKKIFTTILGLAMLTMLAPTATQAVTIEELQAQIAALMAQLAQLQAQQGATGTPAACSGITFTRNLTVGSSGTDVKCLQAILNQATDTQVAATRAGSPGAETTYFGGLTKAAVVKYQAKNAISPTFGFVGPLTRAKLNAVLGGTSGVTPPVTPVTGTGLTVALATDTPVAASIVDGQAQAPLAKFTFTNGDSAEVKVTNLKLNRIGVSADATLTNVYLFDGATRLTDAASVSSGVITFNDTNGIFAVPAGGSKTILVVADVDGTSGETMSVSVNAVADVTSNATSVKGTYPMNGNLMTLATATLAGVNFNATTTPSAASIDPQNEYTVWQNSTTVTTRAVDLNRISLRKTGSVANTDIQNLKLYIDGVQVGSTMPNLDSNGYVTFDLTSSPKRLEAGTRVIKLLGDIVKGSSLTFTFHLWTAADVTFVDSQYKVNVLPQANSTTFAKRSSGEQTVNSGVLTITKKTDSPSGNIVDGASNATLAKFEIKAAGEKIKIETLKVAVVVSDTAVGYLRNGALYANGIQVGSTANLYDTSKTSPYYTSYSLGSSLMVEPGSPVTLEVRADIFDNDGTDDINADDTIAVRIEGSSSEDNAIGMVSAATIDAPSSDVDANTLTVKTGSLSLSKDPSYTNQSAVAPVTAYKLAAFNLAANTTEAVNITAINVALDDVSSYTSNLYVKYGTKTTSVKATTAASNSWSINETLAAGATIPIEVYVDVSSGMTSGNGIATVDIDGTTVSSATSADSADTTTGQTITFTSGTFATAFASTPQNQTVSGNQEVEIGRWKFTSSYQNYTIQEVKIDPDVVTTSSDNAEDAVVSVSLKDGSTVLATQNFNAIDTNGSTGGYYFTGLNVSVPANTSKTLTTVAKLSIPSATAGNSGLKIQPRMSWVKYMDPNGTVTNATPTNNANSTYVYRTVPTLTKIELDNSTIANGQVLDLYKFKVSAPSQGDVYIKQFKLDVAWSDGGTDDELELNTLKLYKDGVDITASVTIQEEDYAASVEGSTLTTGITEGNSRIIVTWDGDTEDTIPAGESTNYTIQGVPQEFRLDGATDVASDSVAISLAPDSADVTFGSQTVDFIGYLNIGTTLTSIMKLYTAAAANASAENAQIIWSDGSAVAHSASTTAGTNDWTNGYLVKDALSSETWTR